MKLKGLISEDGVKLSLGRTVFWMVLPIMFYYWCYQFPINGNDAPGSLTTSFISILGYNLGKKYTRRNKGV